MHARDRQKACRIAETEMAAHRRLFSSARRHADRRVLAGGKAAVRRLGARSGRRHLSRPRIAVQRRDQRAGLARRIGRAHDAAHHRDAGAARGNDFGNACRVDAADGEHRDARGARYFGKTLAADLGAIAGLARRLEGGAGERIVGRLRVDRLGFGRGVDRNADELSRPHQGTCRGGVTAGRQMHAIGAGELRQCRLAMQHKTRAMPARDRQQRAQKRNLFVFGQILFAQTDPAAAGRECGRDNLGERPPRLVTIGHQQQRLDRELASSVLAYRACPQSAIMGIYLAGGSLLHVPENHHHNRARRSGRGDTGSGVIVAGIGREVEKNDRRLRPVHRPLHIRLRPAQLVHGVLPASTANQRRCRSGAASSRAVFASHRIAERKCTPRPAARVSVLRGRNSSRRSALPLATDAAG